MHLTVGDHCDAGEALSRHVGHRAGESGEKTSSVIAGAWLRLAGTNHAHIEIALTREAVAERRHRILGRFLAVTNSLARRLVDDNNRSVALRRSLFLDHRRIDEGRQ